MPKIEERVSDLEKMMKELIYVFTQSKILHDEFIKETKAANIKRDKEMQDFKNEMQLFKNEMTDFKTEMADFKNEMTDFKKEMSDFKNEMIEYRIERKIASDKHDKEIAQIKHDLAITLSHQGTLVENMAAPDARIISESRFGFTHPIALMIRPVRHKPNDLSSLKELDILVVDKDNVLLVECKSNPRPEYARVFARYIKSGEFFEYYPEYIGKKLIPVFASVYIPDNVMKYLTTNRIYAMGLKGDIMDILNMDEIKD